MGLRLKRSVLATILISATAMVSIAHGQGKKFMVVDGLKYTPDQFEEAMRSPTQVAQVRQNGSELVVPRSVDGHFYIPGSVNGHPVVWLLDTGASHSAIPMQAARNAGIRGGMQVQFDTAGGKQVGAISENNEVMVGQIRIPRVPITMMQKVSVNLLGASALKRLNISYEGDSMVIRSGR